MSIDGCEYRPIKTSGKEDLTANRSSEDFDFGDRLAEQLQGIIDIDVIYASSSATIIKGQLIDDSVSGQAILNSVLDRLPFKAEILSLSPKTILRFRNPARPVLFRIPWLNLALFLLTLVSTIVVGSGFEQINAFSNPRLIIDDPWRIIRAGVPFSFSLLGILLFHEFGHYIVSRKHGVDVSLPYFIPAPTMIGTMGAVIRSKSPFITRKQLFDVGAAGPIGGLIIAIPAIIWGLAHPRFIPEVQDLSGLVTLGDSLLFSLIDKLVAAEPPPGYIAVLHPVAFAGWVGLLVTMLNLLPIGQLDGGHILYAMFGKLQHKIALIAIAGLIMLSFFWTGWIVWAILGTIMRPAHPPTVMDELSLDKKRKMLGYLCIVVFILCFIPAPITLN